LKSIGIVRRVDELGRVCLPIELRRHFGIEYETPLEIFVDGNYILLRKYAPGCQSCGSIENVESVLGVNLCLHCMKIIGEYVKEVGAVGKGKASA